MLPANVSSSSMRSAVTSWYWVMPASITTPRDSSVQGLFRNRKTEPRFTASTAVSWSTRPVSMMRLDSRWILANS